MNGVAAILVTVLVGLATAGRVRRQVFCPDAFKNVPSPCSSAPGAKFYFPHPTDNTKFLQCDIYKRMYIVQCPQGEVYDNSLSACQPPSVVTFPPVVPTVPVATQPPRTLPPVINPANPCTLSAIARGAVYFPVAGDKTRFIECDLAGNPNILFCPTSLLWDQGMLSCVYPITAGSGGNPAGSGSSSLGSIPNPCTATALSSGHYFFPHPTTSSKFIQCNQFGQGFPVNCPSGLIWNAYLETCYRPLPGSG